MLLADLFACAVCGCVCVCLKPVSRKEYKPLWDKVLQEQGLTGLSSDQKFQNPVGLPGLVDLSQNASFVGKVHTLMPTLKGCA